MVLENIATERQRLRADNTQMSDTGHFVSPGKNWFFSYGQSLGS